MDSLDDISTSNRIQASPHYEYIKEIRQRTYPGAKASAQYRLLSPLQKLKEAQTKEDPGLMQREVIQPGLFASWERKLQIVIVEKEEAVEAAHNTEAQDAKEDPSHWCCPACPPRVPQLQ
ncbi:uncharacterized protein PV09_09780 [Verruconis gallopava]|uniref:Uncharacterized protein n=1 Tax=Verruconis gallopava TaxID=253628 RepID=A0A0D1ZV48_9PEZI|nr:uncharacterized protein PV09_09780 [Verruconis gallopava]KIV98382.1 hypothetical protein PV09_09780 [Verruconis gallopava]